ncbi:hypothetical protein [Croceivirga sp. JEA036]|uniref:hypothetical protein n=1 Tax=Croceivirga sp. JEA036 TaxID=2721162 RepID=UPI001439507F|nr:hypothetical protein [Croceivirga sp. JEA036]NJB36568.1 hypothetical protein [Croceivirga sp. JEA036]
MELKILVDSLSEHELHEFLQYLAKKNRRTDIKNITLVKFLAKGEVTNLDVKLYGKNNKNAFYVLCARVQEALIEFIGSYGFEHESAEDFHALKYLLAARILFEKGAIKMASKVLLKSENLANTIDAYPILAEVIQTKIQFAHLIPDYSLASLVLELEANNKKLQTATRFNIAYAQIRARLKKNNSPEVSKELQQIFTDLELVLEEDLSYKSLYQLMTITATEANLQRNFYAISPYIEQLFIALKNKGEVPAKYSYYYVRMLHLLALSFFRNKEFKKSASLLSELEDVLVGLSVTEQKALLRKRNLLKGLLLLYTGKVMEAEILLKGLSSTSLDVKLVLVMCLFQQGKYKEVYRELRLLKKSDNWYEERVGWAWVLKKNILELLTLIELQEHDSVYAKGQQFRRKFKSKLAAIQEERVLTFIRLVLAYAENPSLATTPDFEAKVENAFYFKGRRQEDIFVMSFYAWLKSKLTQQDLYAVTLDLVSNLDG